MLEHADAEEINRSCSGLAPAVVLARATSPVDVTDMISLTFDEGTGHDRLVLADERTDWQRDQDLLNVSAALGRLLRKAKIAWIKMISMT